MQPTQYPIGNFNGNTGQNYGPRPQMAGVAPATGYTPTYVTRYPAVQHAGMPMASTAMAPALTPAQQQRMAMPSPQPTSLTGRGTCPPASVTAAQAAAINQQGQVLQPRPAVAAAPYPAVDPRIQQHQQPNREYPGPGRY